jgi:predicted deacylase
VAVEVLWGGSKGGEGVRMEGVRREAMRREAMKREAMRREAMSRGRVFFLLVFASCFYCVLLFNIPYLMSDNSIRSKQLSELQVGELVAKPGEKVSGFIKVEGTDISMPVTLIAGKEPGLNVLVSAGVHSAEYVGIAALEIFCEETEPGDVKGNLIIIRLMNPSGFEKRTMSMVYEDGKNLNRVFPGDKDGTAAEKIAHTVTEKFFSKAERYIDLHSGDGYESLVPMVFVVGKAPEETAREALHMARVVSVPYMVVSEIGSGGAYNHAGSMGIPSILIERGQRGIWSPAEAQLAVKDLRNVLRRLGVLSSPHELGEYAPQRLMRSTYIPSPRAGFWHPRKTAGDFVKKGEVIGEIRDYFGKVLEAPVFDYDGVILYQVESLTVLKGENLIAYAGDPEIF